MKLQEVLPLCILIFCLLMGIYLITYSGMAVTDDEQLFVVLTGNLDKGLGNNTLPLFGNDRLRGEPANIEPLHPLFSVPFFRAAELWDWGRAQILHLPSGIYTALTCALLALIAIRRGYSRKSAIMLAATYGLGTIALPYARTNFREPLAALCLAGAMLCVDGLRNRDLSLTNILANLAGMLVFVGMAALTKLMCGLCLPFFIIAAWLNLRQHHNLPRNKLINALTILILAGLIAALAFLSMQSGKINNRFTLAFLTDMLTTLSRLPHDHFFQAMAGMLVSPGKGLLIYSPILILAFISLFPDQWLSFFDGRLRRVQPTAKYSTKKGWSSAQIIVSDNIIAFGSLFMLMVMQALLYNHEWWNITWGTRTLLPVLPLLMLVCLPVMDFCLNQSDRQYHALVFGLMTLGFLIQVGRILTTDPAYLGWLAHVTGEKVNAEQWWDLRLMPLWRHWQLAFQGIPGGTAWLHLQGANQTYALMIAGALLLIILACAYLLQRKKEPRITSAIILFLLILGLIPAMLTSIRTDSRYYGDVDAYQQICTWLKEKGNRDNLVLVNAYLKPFWLYNFNFDCIKGNWLGLPYEHGKAYSTDPYFPRMRDLTQLIEEKRARGIEVFLLETTLPKQLSYQTEFERNGLHFTQIEQFVDSNFNGLIIHVLEQRIN